MDGSRIAAAIAMLAIFLEREAAARFLEQRAATAPIDTEAKRELETLADGIRAGLHGVERQSG
jgi:hypothetical protein